MVDINALSDPANRRKKKIFDIITSAIVLILSPLLLILLKDATFKISAAWQVLTGKKTWIGIPVKSGKKSFLKEGVYSPAGIFSNRQLDDATINRIYVLYLKEYDVMNDLKILWHHLKK
jgi:lipopolysaccharide/colanic/teichoic acid biosynthesis glycosyltransferase